MNKTDKNNKERTVILCMGNDIRCDDGAGLLLADFLQEEITSPQITVKAANTAGMRLVDELEGFDRAIIIDAVISGRHQPGTAFWAEMDDFDFGRSNRSLHDMHIDQALKIGEKFGLKMPRSVRILAMEVADISSWSDEPGLVGLQAVESAKALIIAEFSGENS